MFSLLLFNDLLLSWSAETYTDTEHIEKQKKNEIWTSYVQLKNCFGLACFDLLLFIFWFYFKKKKKFFM